MKLILLPLMFLLFSCNEKAFIVAEQISNFEKACQNNDGLIDVSISENGNMARCGNQSFIKQPKKEEEEVYFHTYQSITAENITQCKSLCEMNNSIKEMTVNYRCTGYGRSCPTKEISVDCVCKNSITQVYKRIQDSRY